MQSKGLPGITVLSQHWVSSWWRQKEWDCEAVWMDQGSGAGVLKWKKKGWQYSSNPPLPYSFIIMLYITIMFWRYWNFPPEVHPLSPDPSTDVLSVSLSLADKITKIFQEGQEEVTAIPSLLSQANSRAKLHIGQPATNTLHGCW